MSSLSRRLKARERALNGNAPLAAIDIGSAKIACFIGRRSDISTESVHVAGAGSHVSRGVKAGAVVDMDALERAIRATIAEAEEAASTQVHQAVVGVSGPNLKSQTLHAELLLQGSEVTAYHLREVTEAAMRSSNMPSREILHVISMGFGVDGSTGVRDPRGMYANTLSVNLLVVSAPGPALKNIVECVARAHVTPIAVVAAPYASGLSSLIADEIEEGAILIDMGSGVTGMAAFRSGGLTHLNTLPIGGAHVTSDLAQGLGTTFVAAERIKTLHGAVVLDPSDAFEMIEAPRLGRDGRLESGEMSRGELAGMLRPRVEEICELLCTLIDEASSAGQILPHRIVLTGGASTLSGIREVASDVFAAPVRISGPVTGVGDGFDSPAYAAAASLLRCVFSANGPATFKDDGFDNRSGPLMRRLMHWMQNNF